MHLAGSRSTESTTKKLLSSGSFCYNPTPDQLTNITQMAHKTNRFCAGITSGLSRRRDHCEIAQRIWFGQQLKHKINIYRLKQAVRFGNLHLHEGLKDIKYIQVKLDPCMW